MSKMIQPMWRMADGEEIAVEAMGDSHLLNAYRMLVGKGFISPRTRDFYLYGPMPSGDMAKDCYDREFNDIVERPVSVFIGLFEAEMRKRGINFNQKENNV